MRRGIADVDGKLARLRASVGGQFSSRDGCQADGFALQGTLPCGLGVSSTSVFKGMLPQKLDFQMS